MLTAPAGPRAPGREQAQRQGRAGLAASLAPPCSGPRSVPMPAQTAECRSLRVEATTRAAKVLAATSCSAYSTCARRGGLIARQRHADAGRPDARRGVYNIG